MLLVAVFGLARISDVGRYRLWFDEIFSLQVIHRGWGEVLPFVATYDPHPPLWYLLLKLWTTIAGDSFPALAVFAALPSVAMLVPFFLLARELRVTPRATNVALAILAVNGYLIGTAQELRMYGLLALLALWSNWAFVKCSRPLHDRPRDWVLLTVFNTLLVFTQYYGWLVIGTEGLCVLVWNRPKLLRFTLSCMAVCAAQLPWVLFLLHYAAARVGAGQEAIAFTARPTAYSVAWFYSVLLGGLTFDRSTTIAVGLCLMPVALWWGASLVTRRSDGDQPQLVLLSALAFVPACVAAIVSVLLPFSVWGQRHLVIVAVPFVLLVASAVQRLPFRALRTGWMVTVLAWAGAAGVEAFTSPYKVPAWDTLLSSLAETDAERAGAPIYALNSSAAYVVRFYLDRLGDNRFRSVVVRREQPSTRVSEAPQAPPPYWRLVLPVVTITSLASLPANHFWVADDGGDDGESASAWGAGVPARTLLQREGFTVGRGLSASVVVRRWSTRRVELFPAWRSPDADREVAILSTER